METDDMSACELNIDQFDSYERIRVATGAGYFPRSVVTRDGAILVVYRAGAGHVGRSGYLVSVRSEDGGRTWSEPVIVVNTREYDDRNPALGLAPDGTVVAAFYCIGSFDPASGYLTRIEDRRAPQQSRSGLVYSRDGGRSWGEPMLWTDQTPWYDKSPYGRILTLADGRMAMPVYKRSETFLLWSDDGGRSWGDFTLVARDINETAYCPLPSGEWLLLGRSSDGHGNHSLLRWSHDEGRTWSEPQQFLTGRRLPSDLCVLSDGSVLAVHGYRTVPCGVRVRRSLDKGRSWTGTDLVVHDAAQYTDCGYPSVETVDGWIVISFYDATNTPTRMVDPAGAFLEVVRIAEEELIERV